MGSKLLVDSSARNHFAEDQLEFSKLKSKSLLKLKRGEVVESATMASVLSYENNMKLILNEVNFLPEDILKHISKAAENEALHLFKQLLKLRKEDDFTVEKANLSQAIHTSFLKFQTLNHEKKAQPEGNARNEAENFGRSFQNTGSKLEFFNGDEALQKTCLALTSMDKQSLYQNLLKLSSQKMNENAQLRMEKSKQAMIADIEEFVQSYTAEIKSEYSSDASIRTLHSKICIKIKGIFSGRYRDSPFYSGGKQNLSDQISDRFEQLKKSIRWSRKIPGFSPRKEHGAVSVENVICSFGGINRSGHPTYSPDSLDVSVLNVDDSKMKWNLLSTLAKNKFSLVIVSPNQRCGHSAVTYKEFVFIFGGEDTNTIEDLNSTHRFNSHTLKWDEIRLNGNIPCRRYLHSAVVVRDKMFVFGGVLVTNDLYSLDLEMFYWSKIKTTGIPPSPRSSHSATAYKGKFIFIFGGWDYEKVKYSDELFCFDVNSKKWTQPETSGTTPRGREGHSTFVHNGLIYIFGGSNFGSCLNDLFSFDPETCEWKEVLPIGQPPCPREKFGCVAVDNRVFIFGGFDSNERYLDDTFVLEME